MTRKFPKVEYHGDNTPCCLLVRPKAATRAPLILDLNDKDMLFKENIKQPVIEKPPELPPPPEGIALMNEYFALL